MKVELLQITGDKMLAADNIEVRLDGKHCECVTRAELVFDAQDHTPRVTLTIIPTDLQVFLDGKPVFTIPEFGHINYKQHNKEQIFPDDAANSTEE